MPPQYLQPQKNAVSLSNNFTRYTVAKFKIIDYKF